MTTQHIKQNTPEWFAMRRGRITASIVGAILGVAPYMTREEALRRMVRDYHNAESEFTGNVATQYGQTHEPLARLDFEMDSGRTTQDGGIFLFEDWAAASPDALLGEDGLLEIKCPYGIRNDNPPSFKKLSDQPHYYAQIQFQLYCSKREFCYFYQWSQHGSKQENVFISEEWLDKNIPILKQFHAMYLEEINNPEHLEPKLKTIDTVAARQLLQEYDELSLAIELGDARKKEIMAEFEKMADGRNSSIWGRKFTHVERAGSVAYAKIVKEKLPDLDLEPFRGKPTSFWKLS